MNVVQNSQNGEVLCRAFVIGLASVVRWATHLQRVFCAFCAPQACKSPARAPGGRPARAAGGRPLKTAARAHPERAAGFFFFLRYTLCALSLQYARKTSNKERLDASRKSNWGASGCLGMCLRKIELIALDNLEVRYRCSSGPARCRSCFVSSYSSSSCSTSTNRTPFSFVDQTEQDKGPFFSHWRITE